MTGIKTKLRPWLIAFGIMAGVIASMIGGAIAVFAFYPDDWRPVEAEVVDTRIECTRPGTVAWSLMVDLFYEVDGKRYDKSGVDVLHNDDHVDTAAEQADWPAGKRFTLYTRTSDPATYSLSPDGGREAISVVIFIASPAILMILLVSYFIARRFTRKCLRMIKEGQTSRLRHQLM